MGDFKTLDDILKESLLEEVQQEMEKEAAEASTPAPVPVEAEQYQDMQKLAELLREAANKVETPIGVIEDFKNTIETLKEE